ncbi:hypothetical protein D9M70_608450 [compost metagenome]
MLLWVVRGYDICLRKRLPNRVSFKALEQVLSLHKCYRIGPDPAQFQAPVVCVYKNNTRMV